MTRPPAPSPAAPHAPHLCAHAPHLLDARSFLACHPCLTLAQAWGVTTGLLTATECWEARVQDPETNTWERRFFSHPHSAAGWILEHIRGDGARARAIRQFMRFGWPDRKALTPMRRVILCLSETLEGGQVLDRRLMQAVAAEAGLRGVSWRGGVYPAVAYPAPTASGVTLAPCSP